MTSLPPTHPPQRALPNPPNLESEKKNAKRLLKALRTADPEAITRARRHLPRQNNSAHLQNAPYKLSEAQLILAREYGFNSWPKLSAHVRAILQTPPAKHRPFQKDKSYYQDRAQGMLSMIHAGLSNEIKLLIQHHPRFAGMDVKEVQCSQVSLDDTLLAHARMHGATDWAHFEKQLESLINAEMDDPFMKAFEALENADADLLEQCIASEPGIVNQPGTNGNSLLNLATALCERGDLSNIPQPGKEQAQMRLALVKLLIDHGADADLANNKGLTPLHEAAYMGHVKAIDLLLDAGATLTLESHGTGGTPLMMALFWGHREAAAHLARYVIAPMSLRVAAGLGRVDLLEMCINHDGSLTNEAKSGDGFYRPHSGFPIWQRTQSSQEYLDEALTYASRNANIDAVRWLIQHGADPNGEPYRGSALAWAAHRDHVELMQLLIELGADPTLSCYFGGEGKLTPLHIAAWAGSPKACDLFINLGADPNLRDEKYNGPPWGWAAFNGHKDVALQVARAGASTDIFAACAAGSLVDIEAHLTRDAALLETQDDDATPLLQALSWKQVDAAVFLLETGANPDHCVGDLSPRELIEKLEESDRKKLQMRLK